MIAIRRTLDWMFRSRKTGRITVVQFPNVPLGLFLLATIVSGITHPTGTARHVMTVVGTGALIIWAGDELLRGVNPWRRVLGGGILVFEVVRLVAR